MKIAIIGGGPSGLVTLKHLATAHEYFSGLEPMTIRLFDSREEIGGTFRYGTYRDSELVSSKYLTTFSDHRFPANAPDFATPESYLSYLHGYIAKFGLQKYIECSTHVIKVSRAQHGGHVVRIQKLGNMPLGDASVDSSPGASDIPAVPVSGEEDWNCDAVVVCSGLNAGPIVPDLPGLEFLKQKLDAKNKTGSRVIHSSAYKGSDFFNGAKTVAILGAGETAMDVGYQAVNHPDVQKVVMCNRDGFLIAPKITPEPVIMRTWGKPYPGKRPNKPIDTTIASLFDTMYVPPSIQRGPLLWLYYDRWIKYVFFLIAGSSQGIDQWVGGVPPRRRYADALFLVKSDKAVPYMSARHRKGFWNAVRSFFINVPIMDTGDRVIEVKSFPTHIDDAGVMHIPEYNSDISYKIKPDAIVCATGYRTEFGFLQQGQYPTLAQARVRGIYRYIEEGFAYIGFVRPSIGAIPPLSELQAQLWVYRWLQHFHGNKLVRKTVPSSDDSTAPLLGGDEPDEGVIAPYELDYALHARGSYDFFSAKRGVDHESYAFQLALDMGAAPTFWHMVRRHGWKTVYTWAMGPNFNSKFRLVGPWANTRVAVPIMEGELFGVVKRSGGLFFFVTYTLLPFFLFGFMSLTIILCRELWGAFSAVWTAACGVLPGYDGGRRDRSDSPSKASGSGLTEPRVVEYF